MTGRTTWLFLENVWLCRDFLSTEPKKNPSYAKEIITSGGFKDKLEVWASHDNTDVSEFSSTHKEADTRIILHAISWIYKYIVVSSRDTDVLVLLVTHFHSKLIGCDTLPLFLSIQSGIHGIYLSLSQIHF